MFKLFSRTADDLFRHLEGLGRNLAEAGARFEALVTHWEDREQRLVAIRDMEHEGDRLLRDLQDYLKETFFVPGDREAIYALTNELDDVVDETLKIASTLLLYRIASPSPVFVEMVGLLKGCCDHLAEAMALIGNRANRERVDAHCLEVIRLEDQADQVYRRGLEDLFRDPEDLGELLKWKDVLDSMDDAVDHANHVAYRLMGLNSSLH